MQTKDSIGPRPTNPENIFSERGKLNFLPAGTVTQFWALCTWMRYLCPSHRKTAGQSHEVIGHAAGTGTLGTSPFSLLPAMNPQDMQQEPGHSGPLHSLSSLSRARRTWLRDQDPWNLCILCSLSSCFHLSYFRFEHCLAAMVQRFLTAVLSMFVTCHSCFIYNLIRAPWTGHFLHRS